MIKKFECIECGDACTLESKEVGDANIPTTCPFSIILRVKADWRQL